MRLKQYLIEVEFGKSRDQDWPSRSKGVIIFDKNDTYKIKGKTHDLTSHAIKHLEEFDSQYFNNTITDIQNYLNGKDFFVLTKKNKDVKKSESTSKNIIINTLDRINDKIVHNEKLTEEEKVLSKYLDKISKKYEQFIENMISKSIDVDSYTLIQLKELNKKNIKFTIKENNKEYILFIDLKQLWFCVESKGKIKTFYEYKNLDKLKEKVLSKEIVNNDVELWFKQL